MMKVLYIDGNRLSGHYTSLFQTWHGKNEFIHMCNIRNDTNQEEPALEWIAM